MRSATAILALLLGLTLTAPTTVYAKAGFLPGEAQAEALGIGKSSAERRAEREKRLELRKLRRETQRLKREQRTKTASN